MNTAPQRHLALRVAESDLERIDELAAVHKLTRTEYLIRAALGELADPIEIDARLEALDERVQRLESWAFAT